MTQRLVSVGDDFALPAKVVVKDVNLPLRLSEVNTPQITFDQFPIELTDYSRINGTPTNSYSIIRTAGDVVYAVFYGSDLMPYIGRMKTDENQWQLFNLGTLPGNPLQAPAALDEHNNIAMMVDNAGYIHIAANHHRSPLNYIRSLVPNEITSGWESPAMVGTQELEVTYPCFERMNDGTVIFLYRDGTSGDGDLLINTYNDATKTWSRIGMILNGHLPGAGDNSAYPGRYCYDDGSGRLHMWWTWRDNSVGGGSTGSNNGIHYMYSLDKGVTWKNAASTTMTLPLVPTDMSAAVLTGVSGIAISGTAADTSGNAYAIVRMDAPINEMRLYKRVGSSVTYTVIGTSTMGHSALQATPDGKIYMVYCESNVAYLKQVAPSVGPSIRLMKWNMTNWVPSLAKTLPGSYTMRLLVNPVRLKPGGNIGGVLRLDLTTSNIDALTAGTMVLPKLRAPQVIADTTRHTPGSYPMVPGQWYGPSGVRANTPALTNGTFRGHIVTAARGCTIVECAANIVTAGSAGSLARFVIYRMDGKVLSQSANFDAATTGLKSVVMPLPAPRVGKNEQVVIGVLTHSASAAGPVFTGSGTVHDSRIAFGNATSYFTSVRSSYSLSSVPVPAVDQTLGFLTAPEGSSVASSDNAALVVVKAGAALMDWDLGTNE